MFSRNRIRQNQEWNSCRLHKQQMRVKIMDIIITWGIRLEEYLCEKRGKGPQQDFLRWRDDERSAARNHLKRGRKEKKDGRNQNSTDKCSSFSSHVLLFSHFVSFLFLLPIDLVCLVWKLLLFLVLLTFSFLSFVSLSCCCLMCTGSWIEWWTERRTHCSKRWAFQSKYQQILLISFFLFFLSLTLLLLYSYFSST